MPFIVYRWGKDKEGFQRFERVEDVSLAGRNGPMARHVQELLVKKDSKELRWHMTESEILSRLGKPAEQYALIIDLKPNVKNTVSLYQLRDIWGFSYSEWTPIAIRLETLYVDEYAQDPTKFKQSFGDEKSERDQVHEFLYLQGGTDAKGSWSWGPVGSVNGALLYNDALNYFIPILTERLEAKQV